MTALRRAMLALLLAAALATPATPLVAQSLSGRHTYTVTFESGLAEDAERPGDQGVARAMARITRERLERRLDVAEVHERELRVVGPKTIEVETGAPHDAAWMRALLTTPGRLELRPRRDGVPDWRELARSLPEGVEIRGEDRAGYLWAATSKPLRRIAASVAVPGADLIVGPSDDGYRIFAVGPSVATEREVKLARVSRAATGEPFVDVVLRPGASAGLAGAAVSKVQEGVIVVDGELVGTVRLEAVRKTLGFQITTPRGSISTSREQQLSWVRQVAGRLAAPLPIPIAVL